jgi:hypothetical protein
VTAGRMVSVLLLVAACMRPSWNEIAAGAQPREGTVAIVGALSLLPPVEQQSEGSSHVIMAGAARDRMYGVFTTDLRRPFGPDLWEDQRAHYSVYLPFDGAFFIEIPRGHARLYLRGVVVMTNRGRTGIETPIQITLQPEDDIAYIGHVVVQRTAPQSTQVHDEEQAARQAAQQMGHGVLTTRPWAVRLARPLAPGSYPSPGNKPLEPVPLQAVPRPR